MTTSGGYLSVNDYQAPEWAMELQHIPEKRVSLAMLPTPIHKWNIPDLPEGMTLHIKRDDMTGNILSGNKVRALEFLLAEAISSGCKSIVTWGTLQSNHCRITSVAARELGLDSHLVLINTTNSSSPDPNVLLDNPGNLLPSIFSNSRIYLKPLVPNLASVFEQKCKDIASQIRKETGNSAYYIPVGGSGKVGVFGYIQAWKEMMTQHNICEEFTDVVVACASGGTAAGLAIGNYLTGQKLKIHSIIIIDRDHTCDRISKTLQQLGITTSVENLMNIIDGHQGLESGKPTEEEGELYAEIAQTTGIFVDPVFAGIALRAMLSEYRKNLQNFKGNRLLFIHTGGLLSFYDGGMSSILKKTYLKNHPTVEPNDAENLST